MNPTRSRFQRYRVQVALVALPTSCVKSLGQILGDPGAPCQITDRDVKFPDAGRPPRRKCQSIQGVRQSLRLAGALLSPPLSLTLFTLNSRYVYENSR